MKKSKTLSILLLLALMAPTISLSAKTVNDVQKELAKAQSEYDQKSAELNQQKADQEKLYNEMIATGKEIELTENDIKETENDILMKEREIKDLEENKIPAMQEKSDKSLLFTQRSNNTNFLLNTIMSAFRSGNSTSLDKARSAKKISEEAVNTLKSLSDLVNTLNTEKKNLSTKRNNLEAKKEILKAQKDYLNEVQGQYSEEINKTEAALKNSQDQIEAAKEQKRMYEESGCGPNDVYGVDCANGKIVDSNGDFKRPLKHATITNEFGYNDFYDTGFHSGIDLANSQGTSIYPTAPGIVLYSGWTGDGGGNSVIILHLVNGVNYVSRYCHMSSVSVSKGQSVTTGTVIGAVGNTGNSFGAHCHFEIEKQNTYIWSALENPRNYVEFPPLGSSY